MTDDDDAPPKPPRASWEPPPLDPLPPRKSRAPAKPPRASWEPADPDDDATESTKTTAPTTRTPTSPSSIAASTVTSPPQPSQSGAWDLPDEPKPTAPIPVPTADVTSSGAVRSADVTASGAVRAADVTASGVARAADVTASGVTTIASASSADSASTTSGEIEADAPAALTTTTTSDDPLAPLTPRDTDLRTFPPTPKPRKRRPPTDADLTDDDDLERGGRGGSSMWIVGLALFLVVALGIGAFVLFGTLNKQRYVITCETDEAVPGQGRGFPPWGTRALGEGQWKPMKIPPEAECRERETEDVEELSSWYLEMLETRASTLLQAREVTKIDEASGLLEQALLHARAPERREQRARIERLLGDVQYWRASAKLKEASTALTDAAKQFDAAAEQRPRHVTDASAWATFVRRLADDLRGGPAGASQTAFPPTPPHPDRPPAPPGVALPVEPDRAGSGSEPTPQAPPDAGLPTGGVLL